MSVDSIRAQLEARKQELMRQVASAATAGDSSTLLAKSDELRELTSVLMRFEDVDREGERFLKSGVVGASQPKRLPHAGTAKSGREFGAKARVEFIRRVGSAGMVLRPDHGSIFRTPSGNRVGVAVATERHKNRWFLGLGDGAFDTAVLLCAADSGRTVDICLPRSFFALHGSYLSRSGGQVKFNVARRGSKLILKVPGHQPEAVDDFVDAFAGLDT